ncbi:hypothetical protein RhiirA5_425930 [Rhizophagus irregularis]|uniref:Serine-threonine/tyrosine-protein kinase catalytic domain-containing protein n=1 Tax=Rhizophagus irregularis TaxID=588596 RepID=A0A2N0P537_9GLOM|nr:hypothetical protein RhiirA5_425930 [Rhizophagus irregularis]PKC68808.1 hypothetical protein RhiirA1_456806 [Rhizophagus irregularis]
MNKKTCFENAKWISVKNAVKNIGNIKIIEWIEYSSLENIELIAHGGFGSVYKAAWKDGPIVRDDDEQPWNVDVNLNEVLLDKEYTEAADIYGFGMIMPEVISGKPPFVDMDLALAICFGQRLQIPENTPELYAVLMKRCWDPVPTSSNGFGSAWGDC